MSGRPMGSLVLFVFSVFGQIHREAGWAERRVIFAKEGNELFPGFEKLQSDLDILIDGRIL